MAMSFETLKHLATSWGGALFNDIVLGTARGVAGKTAESSGEALSRRILEMDRDKVSKFLRDDLWKKGGEYQQAAENLLDGQKLCQQRASRPYGNKKRFRPGAEDKYMFNLARLYRLFEPGPPPEKPQSPGGKGGVNIETLKFLWEKYEEEKKAWEESVKEKAEARFEFFKDLGLMELEELEAFIESVHDDKIRQWLELPFFAMAEAMKASLTAAKKVGEKAKSAAKTGWNETGHAVEVATRPLDNLNAHLERRARQRGRI